MKLETLKQMCRYILRNSNGVRTDVFDFQKYYTLMSYKGEMVLSTYNTYSGLDYIRGKGFDNLIVKYQEDIIRMFNIVVNYKERGIPENNSNDDFGMPSEWSLNELKEGGIK